MAGKKQPQNLANIDFAAVHEQLTAILNGMQATAEAVGAITAQLRAAQKGSTIGEQWALTYGETLPKSSAAKMLGVSVNHLAKLVGEGGIKQTPDGRIVVRSAAEWANGSAPKARGKEFRV